MSLCGVDVVAQLGDEGVNGAKGRVQERGIQEAKGVVTGGAEDLPAGDLAEGGRDAAMHEHLAGIERFGDEPALQRGAVGAKVKGRLKGVALHLQQSERGVLRGVERTFAHGPVYGQPHLGAGLVQLNWLRPALPTEVVHQLVGILDRVLPTLDRYISHRITVLRVCASRR